MVAPALIAVQSATKIPSLARFLWNEHKALGLQRTKFDMNGSRVDYFMPDPENPKGIGLYAFRVVEGDELASTISVPVKTPPAEMPQWLSDLLDQYKEVLSQWSDVEGIPVNVMYFYG